MNPFTVVKKRIEGWLGHEITRRKFFGNIAGIVAGSSMLPLPGTRGLVNRSSQESDDPVSDVAPGDVDDWPICLASVDIPMHWGLGIYVQHFDIEARWDSGRYWYRMVDDFGFDGESMDYDLSRKSSVRPLTLGQLIDLMQTSKCIDEPEEHSRHGVIENHWERGFHEYDPDLEAAVSPPSIHSSHYPELAAWYEERGRQWCIEKIRAETEPLCVKNEAGEIVPNPDLVDWAVNSYGPAGPITPPNATSFTKLLETPTRHIDLKWRPTSY
jgi:hypothetical protein